MNENDIATAGLKKYERWYGRAQPPPEAIPLRAGKLSLVYQAGDLRAIRLGNQELLRRVYMAVRDVNWNTIPGRISNLEIDAGDDHFHVIYRAVHESGPLKFRWTAVIDGDRDGDIRFLMDGLTQSAFRYCRIGFCVLHPIKGIAGRPFEARTPDGLVTGTLPRLIAPQTIEGGFEIPIFPACSQLVVETSSGIRIRTDFEGDLFEMEDQRNWSDESFKTYCTPLSLGYPHHAEAGQAIRQEVFISTDGMEADLVDEPQRDGHLLTLDLAREPTGRLPLLGFGLAVNNRRTDQRALELISALRPAHLKVELHWGQAGWTADLEKVLQAAEQTDSALEVAIFLTDDSPTALASLASRLKYARVARAIIFHEEEAAVTSTSPRWIELAREMLAADLPGVPFIGGSKGNFAEINRQRPDIKTMDGVVYTINPQVHATDERSLVEALDSQRDTLITARAFSGALPISVSSITLKPPFNQAATEEEAEPDPDLLPATVDPRQMSLFAAAWTVGSLSAVAAGGAESVTYYETMGWRGLIETASGSPLPDQFRSAQGMIFPVYWVFRFLAGAGHAPTRALRAERPLRVAGFSLERANQPVLIMANLLPEEQNVTLNNLPNRTAEFWRLNEDTMPTAASDVQAFLETAKALKIRNGTWTTGLLPYETFFMKFL